MAGPLSFQPWQWGVIAAVWVAFFLMPATWMWRRAKRDGDAATVWTVLVLVGSVLGVLEYFHHRSILARRAKRAARAEERRRE